MKKIKVIFPVNSLSDFDICPKVEAKSAYVYYDYFLKNDLDDLSSFIEKAKEHNIKLFVNFKNTITDKEIKDIKKLLLLLEKSEISGIMINSYSILEFIKGKKLPYKVYIDSGLDVHNLSGLEFARTFQDVENINLSEEIYIKNIVKIKKYAKTSLSIDSDNLPWIVEDIVKSKAIDTVIIKGDFSGKKALLEGVKFVENILQAPKECQHKKLPFKTLHPFSYETNHFTGEFLSTKGKDFKFSGNIKKFTWKYKDEKLKRGFNSKKTTIPKLTLRLNSLEQIRALKSHIKNLGFNPVDSIEYGEILNTGDLAKSSFGSILDKAKEFSYEQKIKLRLGTPRVLIERDFDRVYEYVKQLFDEKPPYSLVINNIGFWWAIINDNDYNDIPIEFGQGLNLLSGDSIKCLANHRQPESVELSNFIDILDTEQCIKKIKDIETSKKLTVGGSIRIPCSGLCPLNNDSAILSRLSCSAPCHKGQYAVSDKARHKTYTVAVDGFCRMHMFRNKILDLFKYIVPLQKIGVNEFVIDFTCLDAKLVPILINRFLNSIVDEHYEPDENFLNKLYYLNYHY